MAARLAVGLVAGSVLFALTQATFGSLLLLVPQAVIGRLMLWQPVTYAFIETSPMGVIFGALIIWSLGGALEMTWGSRRVLAVGLGCTVLAGVLTVLLSFVFPLRAFAGGTVLASVLWVGFGLAHGRGETNFWGIPLSGNAFAAVGAGFILLNALFSSWLAVLPDLLGVLLVFAYVRLGSPRVLWLRLRQQQLQRQLRGRSKHLRVVDRDRDRDGGKRDQFLN